MASSLLRLQGGTVESSSGNVPNSVMERDGDGDAAANVLSLLTLVTSSLRLAVATVQTSAFSIDNTAVVWPCTAGSAYAATLPPAASYPGLLVIVFKDDNNANAINVTRAGSDTINGATSVALASQYALCALISDGVSKWRRII